MCCHGYKAALNETTCAGVSDNPYPCPQILDENAQLIRVGDICTDNFHLHVLLLTVFIMLGACREHEHQRKINGMHPVSMMPLLFVRLVWCEPSYLLLLQVSAGTSQEPGVPG